MTFEEVEMVCRGYEIRMAKLKEVPRLVAGILINSNRKPGSPPIKLEDVFPLYTDKRSNSELMSEEEYNQLLEMRKRIQWQKN